MSTKQSKICYVMQQYTVGTHMDYVFEMARTLRYDEGLPLTLLIEKGETPEGHVGWVVAQTFRFALLRVIENFCLLLWMRFTGHKIFYIHYSFVSAISAGLITKIFGGTVFYWNCGQPWMYTRPWSQELYEKSAYKLIDYFVTGVEAVVPGYMENYGLMREQIIVIPNWIDVANIRIDPTIKKHVREELSLPQETPLLFFAHAFSTRYGAELLPAIFKEVTNKDAHLIIAGDGKLKKQIEDEFALYGLNARIHMLGYVDRSTVIKHLQAADVFLMPSEGAGSPHSLIEAMAYQVPFVTFDVGGVKETVSPEMYDFIFKYPDTQKLAAGINTLLREGDVYQTFQTAEKSRVQDFAKEKIVSKFVTLLSSS